MKNIENHNDTKLSIEGVSEIDLKRNSFKTPEDYFENLTPRVMESVRSSETSSSISFSWNRILVPTLALAASVMAFVLLLPTREEPTPTFETVLASLTIEELANYADLKPSELVTYELVDYDAMTTNEAQLTNDDILQYLETENEIELNSLVNEIEI